MFRLIPIAAALVLATAPTAQADHDAVRAISEAMAFSIDADHSGLLDRAELEAFGMAVFQRMDINGSGTVTRLEAARWEDGMSDMAVHRGRMDAYEAAIGVVFDLFDTNGDGALDPAEQRAGLCAATTAADSDGDGALTKGEYRDRHLFSIAMRNVFADPS